MSATTEQATTSTEIIRDVISADSRTWHAATQQIFYAHGDEALAADNLREWVEELIADTSEGLTKALATHAAALADWPTLVADLAADETRWGDYEDSLAYRMAW